MINFCNAIKHYVHIKDHFRYTIIYVQTTNFNLTAERKLFNNIKLIELHRVQINASKKMDQKIAGT